jgi:predicted unusual protein kinase regulating ubiquinone biosynthesis (AarF/ABC1/UbiB family)
VAGELRERIMEELDYELEAQHQRFFARAYRGHRSFRVPEVVTELSRRRVTVSEWVDGRPFAAMVQLPRPSATVSASCCTASTWGRCTGCGASTPTRTPATTC